MALSIFSLIIISVYIYPTYISPIFNKFVNLNNDKIKNEIKDLSNQTNFSVRICMLWTNRKEQSTQMHISQVLEITDE